MYAEVGSPGVVVEVVLKPNLYVVQAPRIVRHGVENQELDPLLAVVLHDGQVPVPDLCGRVHEDGVSGREPRPEAWRDWRRDARANAAECVATLGIMQGPEPLHANIQHGRGRVNVEITTRNRQGATEPVRAGGGAQRGGELRAGGAAEGDADSGDAASIGTTCGLVGITQECVGDSVGEGPVQTNKGSRSLRVTLCL